MNERLQALVYGTALALGIGWVLYIGRDVFVPIAFGVLAVYVIVGLTRLLHRIPLLGPLLPVQLRYALSALLIGCGLVLVVYMVMASKEEVLVHAPRYQESLLAAIQRVAVFLRIETEPTWATLRRDLLAQIDIQKLVGSTLLSVSSFLASVVVVVLYTTFLLLERQLFATKLAAITPDPRQAARIRDIILDINARIGSYLALKTSISILLGALCWIAMAALGLEFAGFLAVVIALLNYVPYVGSFLGVLFPVAMAIMQFGNPNDVFAVFAAMTVIQFVIGNFLDPYVMGNSLNLSPFAILVSLTVWSALWGIPGAFLAVPITAIMTIVFSEFAGTRPLAVLLSKNGRLANG